MCVLFLTPGARPAGVRQAEASPRARAPEQVRRGEAEVSSAVSAAARHRTAVAVGMRFPEAAGIAGHSAEMCARKREPSAVGCGPS